MAIKGKKKTRGGRPGTNAPRPVVVAPKRPFLARPSTRWGALGLILVIVGVVLFIAWQRQQEDEERERLGTAVEQVESRVTLALQSVSTPGAGTVAILPQLAAQIEGFKAGDVEAEQVATDTEEMPDLLTEAAQNVAAIEVPQELVDSEYADEVTDAKLLVEQGLHGYRLAVDLVRLAVDLEGRPRTRALNQASEQVALAQGLVELGNSKLTAIRIDLGTFSGTDIDPGLIPPG